MIHLSPYIFVCILEHVVGNFVSKGLKVGFRLQLEMSIVVDVHMYVLTKVYWAMYLLVVFEDTRCILVVREANILKWIYLWFSVCGEIIQLVLGTSYFTPVLWSITI